MNFNISIIIKGMISGFLATIVLTLLMMIKKSMGIMPALDPVHMMTVMVSAKMGITQTPVIGWIMHFGIGTVAWGGGFAILNKKIPANGQIVKGIFFGIAAWFLMMIGPMPMSGAGFFAYNLGVSAIIITFIFHVVFGVALGVAFRILTKNVAVIHKP